MKRILLLIMALATLSLHAQNSTSSEAAIRQIKIECLLDKEGTAHIHEYWDITAASGTEWYLVRDNLGDIVIEDLSVTDENGAEFTNEGDWDVDRDIDEKAGRCGINKTYSGCELCWGVGSYGDHKYDVTYKMRNVAKSLNDYDMLHIQFVNDELSSNPQDVSLVLEVEGVQIDTTNARIWGFGYEGTCEFSEGRVVMQSTEAFGYYSSLILLLRLDKGIIYPTSTLDEDFNDHLDNALSNANFEDEPRHTIVASIVETIIGIILMIFYGGWIPLGFILILIDNLFCKKRWLGTLHEKKIPWYRDIPFEGNIETANHVLLEFSPARIAKKARVASAMIIRMINLGALNIRKDQKGKIEITFGDIDKIPSAESSMRELWKMMHNASGKDKVLQEDEFKNWSKDKANSKRIAKWIDNVKEKGKEHYAEMGYFENHQATPSGVEENRKLYGLKNYLNDFTIIDERSTSEHILWQEYLVFASLFGIADKVAKELKDVVSYGDLDADSIVDTVYITNSLGRSITNAKMSYDASVARSSSSGSGHGYSGGGGRSSYSGGGGYSGGGHGGGSR